MTITPYQRQRKRTRTKTNTGCSIELIREVWAAATFLHYTNVGLSVRGLHKVTGLSTATVGSALKALVDCGYLGRGERGLARTWYIIIPLLERKSS